MSTIRDMVEAANRTADRAIELWQKGEREQAVRTLLDSFEIPQSAAGADYSWLVATWQLLLGHPAKQVLALLHQYPSFVPEWFFANAITLYKLHGDSPISRAALFPSMEIGQAIFEKLTGETTAKLQDGIELEGRLSYPEYGLKLWQEATGAIEWITEYVERWEATLQVIPEDAKNDRHYKLWERSYEIGLTYAAREETSKAKKELLTALKEIRHFGLFTLEFDLTLTVLLSLNASADPAVRAGAAPAVKAAVLDQYAALCQTSWTDRELVMRAFNDLERTLLVTGSVSESTAAIEKAAELLNSLLAEDPNSIDYQQRANILRTLAESQKDAARSTMYCEEALGLMRAYLGPNHGLLVSTMQELHDYLEELGEPERAQTLEAEISRIEKL